MLQVPTRRACQDVSNSKAAHERPVAPALSIRWELAQKPPIAVNLVRNPWGRSSLPRNQAVRPAPAPAGVRSRSAGFRGLADSAHQWDFDRCGGLNASTQVDAIRMRCPKWVWWFSRASRSLTVPTEP
jgi:hypothetical protein